MFSSYNLTNTEAQIPIYTHIYIYSLCQTYMKPWKGLCSIAMIMSSVCVYIYIQRERERERERDVLGLWMLRV